MDTCPRCGTSDVQRVIIQAYDVNHCICNECMKEWIE